MSAHAEQHFYALADAIDRALVAGERHTTSFSGEDTDFIRLNHGKVRQPGHVAQRYVEIRLIRGARHASHALSLSGEPGADVPAVQAAVTGLRRVLPDVTEDPHLLLPTTIVSTRAERGAPLPPSQAIVERVLAAADGHDIVGLLASGPVYRGFANSEGQRNWHAVRAFNLQWSLYFRADKAVKNSYSGLAWSDESFGERMARSNEQLELISIAPRSLLPGKYRAYIAPAAMQEITQLLSWGGFSARALATQQSSLARMRNGAELGHNYRFRVRALRSRAPVSRVGPPPRRALRAIGACSAPQRLAGRSRSVGARQPALPGASVVRPRVQRAKSGSARIVYLPSVHR